MRKSSIYLFLEHHCQLTATHLSLQDNALLSYIDTIAPSEETQRNQFFKEFLNGAYVFIPDEGVSYQALQQIEQSNLINRDRSSSHDSIDTQYAFRSNILGECLFGTREMDSEKGSWLQLEAYHTNYTQMPAHLITYAWYVITGENSGPMGTSAFTEEKPYVLVPPTPEVQSLHTQDNGSINLSDIVCAFHPEAEENSTIEIESVLTVQEQPVDLLLPATLLIQPPLIQEPLFQVTMAYEVLS